MAKERITRQDIENYKREILEQTVLIRLEDVATILSVSQSTVLRRVESKELVSYNDNRTNKNIRFLASDLRHYVNQMKRDRE